MANPPSSSSPLLLPPNLSHPQSSPSPSNPSSPKLKPKLVPAAENDLTTSSPAKKSPPLPWTHQETVNLIQAYQEKWYSLKKGQLKASQWEEVAITVAARCGYDEPSKSSTQCRHKIEKLRKRYRAERVKPYPNSWQYFELMDRMERGPLPIAARPMSVVKYQDTNSAGNCDESDSDDGDGSYGGLDVKKNKLKSINNIVRGDLGISNNNNRSVNRMTTNRNFGSGGSDRDLRAMRNPTIEKRKSYFGNDEEEGEEEEAEEEEEEDEEEEEGEEEEEVEGREGILGKELAAEIRGFAERFMRMENKKIEMMKETERYRMEMENKRMQMIIESQRKIVDTIGRAFGAHKKVKMTQEV